jgi:hypothetical protein
MTDLDSILSFRAHVLTGWLLDYYELISPISWLRTPGRYTTLTHNSPRTAEIRPFFYFSIIVAYRIAQNTPFLRYSLPNDGSYKSPPSRPFPIIGSNCHGVYIYIYIYRHTRIFVCIYMYAYIKNCRNKMGISDIIVVWSSNVTSWMVLGSVSDRVIELFSFALILAATLWRCNWLSL